MAAEKIEVDYEVLENASNLFDGVFERLDAIVREVNQTADELVPNHFRGETANKFAAEMQATVKPRLSRLCGAMDQSAKQIRAIAAKMENSEDEACTCVVREAR